MKFLTAGLMSDTVSVPPAANGGSAAPPGANAALVLSDGSVFWGHGIGAAGQAVGEVCFNTAMTGYQEILTDPSFAGQIITFTFPHIGNVGTNLEDIETGTPAARGCVVRMDITDPSNFRAADHLNAWLARHGLVGISGIDTRRLTRRIRDGGAPSGVIVHVKRGPVPVENALAVAQSWPGLAGMDLAREVSCQQTYFWDQTPWHLGKGFGVLEAPQRRVVAVDYGAKRNILRRLAGAGCEVTVVPASATAEDVFVHEPDGVFLANGPGDPAATGKYAVPMLQEVLSRNVPVFGICLGHQLLALALGAKTRKMEIGHRGANHPVKDLATGKVEITSQNHGFVVEQDTLPEGVRPTHISLFDGSLEGLELQDRPVFSVQYHPEASPGPHDSHYLFNRFIQAIDQSK